jgi:hypothetical protein
MAAKARDTVGWLMPSSLAICVPDLGPVAKRRRSNSVWVVIALNDILNNKWIINKFCVYQYGIDFLNSKNKAVLSAIKKLIIAGLLDVDDNGIYTPLIPFNNTIDTLSIPYQMSIDTPKDKEEVKDKDKVQDIIIEQEQVKTKDERQNELAETMANTWEQLTKTI